MFVRPRVALLQDETRPVDDCFKCLSIHGMEQTHFIGKQLVQAKERNVERRRV